MRLLFAVIPVVGSVMALIFLIRFPLTPSRMEEIRVQLEARRGQV
jgi:GPH family glycoside/pentoside/hexuronide:cation symporter